MACNLQREQEEHMRIQKEIKVQKKQKIQELKILNSKKNLPKIKHHSTPHRKQKIQNEKTKPTLAATPNFFALTQAHTLNLARFKEGYKKIENGALKITTKLLEKPQEVIISFILNKKLDYARQQFKVSQDLLRKAEKNVDKCLKDLEEVKVEMVCLCMYINICIYIYIYIYKYILFERCGRSQSRNGIDVYICI
jgi:hypothetical protein